MAEGGDKVSIVTGAAGGIGRAVCEALAGGGGRVAIVDLDREGSEETAGAVEDAGGEASVHVGDVATDDFMSSVAAEVLDRQGRIDALVNAAGIGFFAPIPEHPVEDFDRVLAVNLRAAFLGMRAVFGQMLSQEGGSIVNVGSAASLVGNAGVAAYVASKHGIAGLTKVGAMEGGGSGVRVNCVCPGPVYTPLFRRMEETELEAGITAEEFRRRRLADVPLGRYGQPEEIAALVRFLVSDESAYMTGAVIPIEGGKTVH